MAELEPEVEVLEAVPIERTRTDLDADLKRVQTLAQLMDSQFSLFGIRFGADAIAGLIPVVGDTLALLPSVYPMYVAKRHGFGRALVFRMGVNVGVDWLIGLIPLVGDIFDIASKANLKNAKLLHRAAEKRRRTQGTT
ncbi:MAG: DUF4112 domain-containing protein [Candidatus Sumerlaeaceae bacterium]